MLEKKFIIFIIIFNLILLGETFTQCENNYSLSNNSLASSKQAIISNNSQRSIFVKIKDENININETWSGDILITNTITVAKSATLTILPGTIIKFQHYRGYKEPYKKLSLFVEGTIQAKGTADKQIWFTSDGAPPINGDWDGIYVSGSNHSFFNYTIIEYGLVGIVQYHCKSTIANSIVRWVNTEGLYAEYSNVSYVNNTLYGNGYHEVALEQFNNATVHRNIFKNGIVALHSENSEVYISNNYFTNYSGETVSIAAHSNATIKENIFDATLSVPQITVTPNANAKLINNDNGTITLPLPIFDYEDVKNYTLKYIPGDLSDEFSYVYSSVDETRRTIKRVGEGLSFGWALEYAMGYLWRFDFWNASLGSAQDLIRLNPVDGTLIRIKNDYIENARGLTFDGEHFFVYDHSQLTISEFTIINNSLVILNSFDIPKKEEGGTQSLTSDGEFLYMPSRAGNVVRKLNTSGTLIEEIPIPGEGIAGGLTWTGTHFWGVAGGRNLTKFTLDWQIVGEIFPVADGTWAIAHDGDYIWTLQRTCESWYDNKMFQIEPLIATKTAYNITVDSTTYTILVESNSSDFGLHYDSIQNEIIYEIYGRQGSIGYSKIYILSSFFPEEFSCMAKIDEAEIPVGITETDTKVQLELFYEHNQFHVIRIKIEELSVDESTTTETTSMTTNVTSSLPTPFVIIAIGVFQYYWRIHRTKG